MSRAQSEEPERLWRERPLDLRVVDIDVPSPPSAAAAAEQREFVTRPGFPGLLAVAR